MSQKTSDISNIYQLEGRVPVATAVPFGLQHILAMFVANIAPIIIVAGACGLKGTEISSLIQCAMIIAGIGTMIQLYPVWRVGSGLPIVMGISFTFVSVFCYIGAAYGYGAIVGSVIIGGIVEGILGLFARYWRKLVSPVVAATVVTSIGFSLLSVGAQSFGGGSGAEDFGSWKNLLLGSVTLVVCLVFNCLAKRHYKQLSVLVGLVVGYLLAIPLGKVDFSGFKDCTILSVPKFLPVKPEFHVGAIVSVIMIYLVSATETIGDTSAIAASGLNRDVTEKEISGSIACDGFVSSVSGLFGCLPITSFSQNVGLVAMTKVVNRFTLLTGAVIMILAGFIPVVGTALATLPDAVLGGCTIMMFGNIVVSGIQMIEKCGFSHRNTMIVALSLSIGLGFTTVKDIFNAFPELARQIFAENCVAVVFVVAILLNLFLPKDMAENEKEKQAE